MIGSENVETSGVALVACNQCATRSCLLSCDHFGSAAGCRTLIKVIANEPVTERNRKANSPVQLSAAFADKERDSLESRSLVSRQEFADSACHKRFDHHESVATVEALLPISRKSTRVICVTNLSLTQDSSGLVKVAS